MKAKISNKEKNMLLALGIVLVGAIYYQFVYTNVSKFIDQKKEEKNNIETKYNNALNAIENLDNRKSELKMLNARIKEEGECLYPTISQEHIILEIDELIKKCSLEGGVEFEDIKLDSVKPFKHSEKDKAAAESSVEKITDKYNTKYGPDSVSEEEVKKNSDTSLDNVKVNDSSSSSSNKTESSTDSNSDGKDNEIKIKYLQGKIKFYGTYENVVKFVDELESRQKKFALYGIGMDINNETWVKGELGIIAYSIPKINDDSDEKADYLTWIMNNVYGKAEPFQKSQSAGTGIQNDGSTGDFTISVKSINSELPTIMIGKSKDNLRTSYVYADGNNTQEAEIVFTEKDGKYYYKYKTANGSMPVDYNNSNMFTPLGNNIVININSESRSGQDDKSGLKLKIINDTGRHIVANIYNDDKEDSRIAIDGDKNNISINEK
ncbi:MAG: pilus assembly protein PilO [Clostridium sp.]